MKITSLDLELNQPSGKIIQIGACVGDTKTGEVIKTYCCDIRIDEILEPRIIKLTGITQERVDAGKDIFQSYLELASMHKEHQCFINPITWGGGDSIYLKQQRVL